MTAYKHFFFPLIVLLFLTDSGNAQDQDTTVVYDTVTVYKDPYVINKTVVLPPLKRSNPASKVFFSAVGGIQYYHSYNSVCESCQDFYTVTKTTNKPAIGYLTGGSLMFKPGRLFFSISVLYNQYREKFNFTDSSTIQYRDINKLVYLDNFIGTGLRVGKDKNVQLLVSAEARLSLLNKIQGSVPDTAQQQSVVSLQEVHQYRKTAPGVHLSVKLLCKLFYKTYLMPELNYGFDLKSIVNNTGPFTIQRNIPSLRLSLTRGF